MQPWERMDGEGAERWAAFLAYRDLGPGRSVVRAAEQVGKSLSLLERWSADNDWVDRVQAWDEHLARVGDEAREDAVREMHDRHARVAMAVQARAVERPASIDPRELTARDIANWLATACAIERVARGLDAKPPRECFPSTRLPPLVGDGRTLGDIFDADHAPGRTDATG